MAKVLFKRKTTDEIKELEIQDGALIYNTDNGKTYMDFGDNRIQTGGNADTIIARQTTEPTDEDIKLWINPDKMVKSPSNIIDMVYPVGSYYETSDTTFNPNTTWGGTWVLDSAGKVTVSQDTNDTDFDTVGETGGSKELQEHSHKAVNFTSGYTGGSQSGLFTALYGTEAGIDTGYAVKNAGTGNSGNLQPYIVVKRWHRTA